MKRVVITGLGVISALGNEKDTFFDNIKAGKHGFSLIERFDTSDMKTKIASEIKDFDMTAYGMEKKEGRRIDRFSQLGIASAVVAMNDCKTDFKDLDPFRVGVVFGSGIGGICTLQEEILKFAEKGAKRVSPFFVPMIISNILAGYISMKYNFKGDNYCPVTACASSTHAIGQAYHLIKHGYQDAVITGGAEAAIIKISIAGFENMMALSSKTDPDRCSIPFDKERDGFVMGEGAATLVLEEYEHAKKRGATIYAEVVGFGSTADAFHITSPDPEGAGAKKAMELAISSAGISPCDIDYINAHGTSTPLNDKYETGAIKQVFGEYANKVAISSTKSMTGHMLGAAGAIEALICALSLKEGVIPPTIGYKEADPECDLDYVTQGLRKQDITYALSNSLGFGGHNATLCMKKYTE